MPVPGLGILGTQGNANVDPHRLARRHMALQTLAQDAVADRRMEIELDDAAARAALAMGAASGTTACVDRPVHLRSRRVSSGGECRRLPYRDRTKPRIEAGWPLSRTLLRAARESRATTRCGKRQRWSNTTRAMPSGQSRSHLPKRLRSAQASRYAPAYARMRLLSACLRAWTPLGPSRWAS